MPITAGVIAAPIVGGLIGNAASAGDRAAATAAKQAALQRWLSINVPSIEDQKVALAHYQQTGQLTPQLQQVYQQQQSKLNNVSVDPKTRAAQMSALSKMQDISSSNGLDAQAQADNAAVINRSNSNEKGQRDAITQNFAQRGVGGAGAELAAKLQASQSDANSAAQAGLSTSANAQQRALQAMTQGSALAGTIHNQDTNQADKAAEAQDAINRFNTANSQNVSGQNVAAQNDAAKYNTNTAQNISNLNTGIDNTQELHNQGLYQTQFGNEATVAAGAGGAYNGVAAQDTGNADRTSKMWAGIGSAVGQGAAAYGQNQNNQSDKSDAEEE